MSQAAADRVKRSDSGTKGLNSPGSTPKAGDKAMGTSGSGLSGLAGFGSSFGSGSKSKGTAETSRSSGSGTGAKHPSSSGSSSTDKAKAKAALNQTDPAALRGIGSSRVSTFTTSRGVAAALGQTMPLPGSIRTRTTSVPSVEQEHHVGEVTLVFGSSSFQGMRDYQEDTLGFLPTSVSYAAGVFDGHGGDQVSKELERVLLQNIQLQLADLLQPNTPGPPVAAVQAAIATAYTWTNNDIGQRLEGALEAGSCAVSCHIARAAGAVHLFCANAGDCRAVLYTGPPNAKRAVRLSEDHKPQPHVCPSEIARVCNAGGCVLWGRVQGCLAVSRAFGDKTLQPYVIADPHVSARALNPDVDSFLYLVSDGVTDLIEDGAGCAIVHEQLSRGKNTSQAAAALVQAAYQQGSSDNISAIVIRIAKRR